MRRPLVGLSLLFSGGVWIGLRFGHTPWLTHAALAVAVCAWSMAAILLVLHRNRIASLLIYGLTGLLGIASITSRHTSNQGLSALVAPTVERMACSVEGVVNQDIMNFEDSANDVFIRFGLRCDSIVVDGASHSVSDSVRVTLYGTPHNPPVYGERWALEGTLVRGKKQSTPWMFIARLSQSERKQGNAQSLSAFSQRLRRHAAAILAHGVESRQNEVGVLNALLLGYRTRLPPDVKQSFTNTGTMHIFAISGLHVAILCSVLVFAIGLLRVPRTSWVFALAPIIMLYTLTTGSRASAIRAGIMASAYLLAPALRRRPDAVSAMALAAILILIWQPTQLMDIGFIFSFAAVAGILAIVPVFESLLQRWLQPDLLAVSELTDAEPWWRGAALWSGRLIAVSLAAWLTSVPLSLYFFGRFTPIALVANLLVIPMSFLIIMTGCLSLAGGTCIGLWLAGIFNAANVVFVRLLNTGMSALEAVPYGHSNGWQISYLGMTLWYSLLAYAALYLRKYSQRDTRTNDPQFDL